MVLIGRFSALLPNSGCLASPEVESSLEACFCQPAVMDPLPENSLFLVRILEELNANHNTMSYQDLCKSLCRFNLAHLAKLRSLLFYTACLDPSFPATLFKDKMRCSNEDPHSKKLMVAADIVTMFNLIQMNGGIAKDKLDTIQRPKYHKNHSVELSRHDIDAYHFQDCLVGYKHVDNPVDGSHRHHQHTVAQSACSKASDCNCQQFMHTSDSNFLLGVTKDMRCRATSLDKLHHLPQYSSSPPSPPCEILSTYFPMDIDSKSITDKKSLQHIGHSEPFPIHSCIQKRTVFTEDFHNFVAFPPQVTTTECKQGRKAVDAYHRRELHKPATFLNHSFELPSNPYSEPILNSPLQGWQRVKHESLDNLQASTYFGPTTVSECMSSRKPPSKAGKHQPRPVKSLSLNTEDGPPDFERSFQNSIQLKEIHHHNFSIISTGNEHCFQSPIKKAVASPSGFANITKGIKTKDVASGPAGVGKSEAAKRFKSKTPTSQSFQGDDGSFSVGTQTEQSEQKKVKEYTVNDRDKHIFKHSEEEIVSDDISDIFRFLDDTSICDSLGLVQPSCYNSNGSLSQVTLKSEGDSSPERNTVKLAKSKLDSLFHSLENTDDELKSSVCKLVMRIGEIEKKLESLSGVRREISQVLSKLNKLDEKIKEPELNRRHGEVTPASRSHATPDELLTHLHLHPNTTLSPSVFQCHTTGHNVKKQNDSSGEWGCSDGDNSDILRIKALKKSMFTRRLSRSFTEENTGIESKVSSITNSPRDWRTVSYSCHPGDEDKDRESKDRHQKTKETERDGQYELPQAFLPSNPPKESYLIEQVFSPHPFQPSVKAHVKGSPLYTDLRFASLSDDKRSQRSQTIEYKRNSGQKGQQLSALDLQMQESLNPNTLEYWMEDIAAPGYESLIKRKEAEFRRARMCKIGALIAAATCTVILGIVIPICTLKT